MTPRFPFLHPANFLVALTLVAATVNATFVRGQEPAPAEQEIVLEAGDVFEILSVTGIPDMQHTWVLTKERTFVEASRDAFFHARLVEPGLYKLEAAAFTEDRMRIVRRTFSLVIRARDAAQASSQPTIPAGNLIETDPPLRQGIIRTEGTQEVIRISVDGTGLQSASIDTDTTLDTNGDADPANDNDSKGSFFETNITPLHLWLASAAPIKQMKLSAVRSDNTTVTQDIRIMQGGDIAGMGDIQAEPMGDGTYRFSYGFSDPESEIPYLSFWQFGDGTQSMLTEPLHTFDASGTYDVSVIVRDLTTGTEVMTATSQIEVDILTPGTGEPILEPAEEPEDEEPVTNGDDSPIWTILWMLLIGLLSIAVGIGLTFALSLVRRRVRGLSNTLEQMESKIVEKSPTGKGVIDVPAAPMELKKQETPVTPPPAPAPKPAPIPEPAPKPTPEPAPTNGAVPPWLQQGLATQKSAAPTPTPAPQPKPEPTPAPAQAATALPPWLKPTAEPQTPAPAQEPTQPAPKKTDTPPTKTVIETPAATVTVTTPSLSDDEEKEERERERKRRKRQRYRENIKKRKENGETNGSLPTDVAEEDDTIDEPETPEQKPIEPMTPPPTPAPSPQPETKDDPTIAIIRAESIEEKKDDQKAS